MAHSTASKHTACHYSGKTNPQDPAKESTIREEDQKTMLHVACLRLSEQLESAWQADQLMVRYHKNLTLCSGESKVILAYPEGVSVWGTVYTMTSRPAGSRLWSICCRASTVAPLGFSTLVTNKLLSSIGVVSPVQIMPNNSVRSYTTCILTQ